MQCTKCGKELRPGERFCQYCGQPVYQPAYQQPYQPVQPSARPAVTPSAHPVIGNAKYQYLASAFLGISLFWLLAVITGLLSMSMGLLINASVYNTAGIFSVLLWILSFSGSLLTAGSAGSDGAKRHKRENIQSILAIVLHFLFAVFFILIFFGVFRMFLNWGELSFYMISVMRPVAIGALAFSITPILFGFLVKKTLKSMTIFYLIVFVICLCLTILNGILQFGLLLYGISLGIMGSTAALLPNVGHWKD